MSGLSDFFEDLRTSNYVRLWALFWFIGVIVIGVGVSSYVSSARDARREQSFRLWEEHNQQLTFPIVRFEVLNASKVQLEQVACATNDKLVRMTSCPDRQGSLCQEMASTEHPVATAEHNYMNCLLNEIPVANNNTVDRNYVILFSIVENQNISSSRTYLQPSDQVEVYLEKSITEYDHKHHGANYWVKPVYVTNRADLQSVNITIKFESFNVKHWIRYDSFTAWNAVAAIGGLILFVYIMHTIVMAFISLAFSPAETLTFGSARQYSVV